jgi:FixJ family two-component response regulator
MALQAAGIQEQFMDLLSVDYSDRILSTYPGSGPRRGVMAETALIAIVDDDQWMRRSLERLLKSAGLTARGFASAEDYLNARNHDEFGCIILDIGLPGMSGFDLDRRLAAEERRLPVVFVSARDEPEVRQEAAQAGAVAFLGKPYDDNALLDAVHTALKRAKIKNQ